MRKDMYKVIVERERLNQHGIDKGQRRRARDRVDYEEAPYSEGMRPRSWDRKELNENLNPLWRFLNKSVGRPWSEVFAEICENIDTGSTVKQHVRQHVTQAVRTDVVLIDGKPYYAGNKHKLEPYESYSRFRDWYVCPETGLLKKPPKRKWKRSRPEVNFVYDEGATDHCYLFRDDVWWYVELKAVPSEEKVRPWSGKKYTDPEYVGVRDCFAGTCFKYSFFGGRVPGDMSNALFNLYGNSMVYGAHKRQMNRREVRRLKLNERLRRE